MVENTHQLCFNNIVLIIEIFTNGLNHLYCKIIAPSNASTNLSMKLPKIYCMKAIYYITLIGSHQICMLFFKSHTTFYIKKLNSISTAHMNETRYISIKGLWY